LAGVGEVFDSVAETEVAFWTAADGVRTGELRNSVEGISGCEWMSVEK
jgi:hypothetical protein